MPLGDSSLQLFPGRGKTTTESLPGSLQAMAELPIGRFLFAPGQHEFWL